LLYTIGDITGECDIERIAALPLPVIFGWRDYLDLKFGDAETDKAADREWITGNDKIAAFFKMMTPGAK